MKTKQKLTSIAARAILICAFVGFCGRPVAEAKDPRPAAPKVSAPASKAAAASPKAALSSLPNSITLEWDAHPDPEVNRYRAHFGTASGAPTQTQEVSVPETTLSINGLDPATTYFIVLTALTADGRESAPSAEVSGKPWAPRPNPLPPTNLRIVTPIMVNVSTRAEFGAGDRVAIGGFIIRAAPGQSATCVIRAIGPSLVRHGISGVALDPSLELHNGDGAIIARNEDWIDNRAEILATTLAPEDDREAALVAQLSPGAYTAVVTANGAPGVGLVEVYQIQ